MEQKIYHKLPDILLSWYYHYKRDLPWRKDTDPYHVWISEIMLQQTRVEAVKGYYTRFLEALPTIESLAQCEDDELHKLWEGLGYYSRVRNLKKAAQMIMDCHDGAVPADYRQVLSLPGIGEYTAGAICSICFNMPTPAVDGNVLRVIARLTGDDTPIDTPKYKEQVRDSLAAVYPQAAGDFTQAIMELGATVCGPNKKPDCCSCPCNGFCEAFLTEKTDDIPVKKPKKQRREEAYTVFILSCNGQYAVEKRPMGGLLAQLWQFPNVLGTLDVGNALKWLEDMGLKPMEILKIINRNHIFTHIEWKLQGIYCEVSEINSRYVWKTADDISRDIALPTAFRQFWEVLGHV